MGFNGSPLATSVSRIATCIITAAYYYFWMPRAHPRLVQGHSAAADLRGAEPEDILPAAAAAGEESKADAAASLRAPLLRHENGANGTATVAATASDVDSSSSSGSAGGGGGGGKLPFRQAFWRFMALAIPGGIMVGLEAWSFDWTVTFSAQFGTEYLDAHQSMMSVSALTYLSVPLAVAISATIRVGNLLGAQQPKQVSETRDGRVAGVTWDGSDRMRTGGPLNITSSDPLPPHTHNPSYLSTPTPGAAGGAHLHLRGRLGNAAVRARDRGAAGLPGPDL